MSVHGSSPQVWGTPTLTLYGCCSLRFIPTGVGNTQITKSSNRVYAVHPHRCGEHKLLFVACHRPCGSSPQVWGTHEEISNMDEGARFIPTGVGNTNLNFIWLLQSAVHPHRCGEHCNFTKTSVCQPGSSPQVWGTPNFMKCFSYSNRFIPTGVGNTLSLSMSDNCMTVHPHRCGEH